MERRRKSQRVRVKALRRVVSMIIPVDTVPSCPIAFAMTKPLTVAGPASIARIDTRLASRKPRATAMGRKRTGKRNQRSQR